ncbi:hypothetical protein ACUH7Y_25470 [Clostridium beijerinckii]|uniref:Phosphatase n=1 Tax=Clostridium beijerinckii TaxID=1520 RepID=A0A7X9SRL1_CLOBE|nr:phosphatase [Clostridium beijerinckii]NMF06582.1 phosphatase [Clostridium beijerinckii]
MAEIKEVSQEEIKQAKREYMKEYRSKNKEKFKEYQNRWYAKRVAAAKEAQKI